MLLLLPLLTGWACSPDGIVVQQLSETVKVNSTVVTTEALMDVFQCDGNVDDVPVPVLVAWSLIPETTGSLAMIMHQLPHAHNKSEVNAFLLRWDTPTDMISIADGVGEGGHWLMGTDRDGRTISYTSPCTPSTDMHEYTLTVYALSDTPVSLPTAGSLEVNYQTMTEAIETVEILERITLTFNDINE